MSKITLGYWNFRGLVEPIRYLLHYKKVDFNDKRYEFGSGQWFEKDKQNLRLDFPNLPYLIISDNIRVTQSMTILRYLARKYKLDGSTEKEKLEVEMLEQVLEDLRWVLISAALKKDLVTAKVCFTEKVPGVFKLLQNFLGYRDYLVGKSLTYVDFLMAETFDFYRYFVPEICRQFQGLKAHHERIRTLSELQSYLHSSSYKRWPIFGPICKFGYGGEEPSRY